jgi:hypothetical protein
MNWQPAAEFAQNQNLISPPGVYALDLMNELGEVSTHKNLETIL